MSIQSQTHTSSSSGGAGDGLGPDVLERLTQLNPEALEQFFDAYFDRIYGYVRGLVRHEQLAEDLTQDIFVQLYKGLPSYDPKRELRPWVFTVAINRVRDHWRSRRHRDSQLENSIEFEDDSLDVESEGDSPDLPLLQAESDQAIRDAVERLPEVMREVVVLRAFEGLSFAQIGELVQRNEVAVRKRYSRALEELRRLMDVESGGAAG